ncbi:hypothetical protein GNZ12_26765 [Paraburkholderia sp. 1N]|uniref:Antitoxin VbhA domain-containing protein n=1 Tax=Paraburkholderia solitsugae TaxID=2675748 RepID=A0ABX2BVE2_9BURK|nr:antitoxin VbhA family protein [Paraburkholderia solitsugae]NPT44855.1 hypothetical protein [Paraburkholderia solitsugae]
MSEQITEQERLERRLTVDNAIATQQLDMGVVADLEAYARGELTLEQVRDSTLARERKRTIGDLTNLYNGIRPAYEAVGNVIGGLVLLTAWAYCSLRYGFLLGFGFGWVPAAILGFIATRLWPLFIVLLIVFWTPMFLICVGAATEIKSFFH